MASRICWNCEVYAHHTQIADAHKARKKPVWFRPYQCDECRALSIASVTMATEASATYSEANRIIDDERLDITWLPKHVLGRRFDDVPEWISDAASEAYACYSIRSYRAAILLARSVVEAVAKDHDIQKGHLEKKIDEMAEKNLIRPLIRDTAHEIRHLGNEMAHGDFVEPVTDEDADDMLDFMSVMLAEVYQLPARVNARQATREERKQAAKERLAKQQ